jgi:hypothetical protein
MFPPLANVFQNQARPGSDPGYRPINRSTSDQQDDQDDHEDRAKAATHVRATVVEAAAAKQEQ